MLSSGANLKWTQEGKTFNFLCDSDAPLTLCKEALFQFQAYVARIEEQVKAQAEAQAKAASENKVEAIPETTQSTG